MWRQLSGVARTGSSLSLCRMRGFSALVQDKALVDGAWVDSSNAKATFEVRNPANGAVIGKVPNMTVADAQKAIDAAKQAYESKEWRSLTAKDRSNLLKKWHKLIEQHSQEIAEIMTAESGKPINESKGEVAYGNAFVEWFAEEARRIYGEIVPSASPNREIIVMKQPIGVAALITPWNFPMAMITRKAGAALAAGCTVVVKPSEDTPLTALAVAKLAVDAGIPKGVINVVTTNKAAPIGDLFCKSPDVRGISFTGSTEVGKLLFRNSADGIKRICLELGGNAPFIVFDSADIEKAVDGAMASKFRNCGQTCVSANRFFVQDGVYDKFVGQLKKRVEALKIGDGQGCDVQIGPLINEMQFNKVSGFVEDARSKKANIILGGQPLPDKGSLFYAPTIVTDVPPSAQLYSEEVFGPVVSIIRFRDEDEAVKKANDTRRGLAGYFYSENLQQVFRVAKRLEVGMVGVNEGIISAAEAPFGGVKESGVGREGSKHGIDDYVDIKYICMGNLKYD
ncbi:succinate-semialdehyde dehydrogenase [NADP(+)] GabD [Drosophila sechellia]|uniref:Succinate-semialdehyde dehydrogenase n=1 Tax=Drosophila sechellia TaxID=7238 RepID=B4ICB5_DROSE|nr:succinate-semialdehyde dehydrogenase [NADP(+)] GabD [Drosophila sechellia]XP_032577307.1 succinate-semialdehyde dehydrogenase [NADP(+)] GabD [Drosophila sechellia]XP_032577308.1 succinate-semialdehyde dehydrogenase [NADP(+)] GabD [Drosophila sechellia]XP_032577309.1 succinate-semialdehyde dehydrogenase [NADP(+)] GabD [Drosophila sechellia]EDW45011.1 GM10233 [Drosophila sechellia]